MTKSVAVCILLFAVPMLSCDKKTDKVKDLKEEVMDVHNQVMPMMGDLRKTSKNLEMKAEALDSVSAQELKVLAQNLDSANEFMMEWMRQYEPDLQGTEEELLEYYSAQRRSVQMVSDSMTSALEKGKKALQ